MNVLQITLLSLSILFTLSAYAEPEKCDEREYQAKRRAIDEQIEMLSVSRIDQLGDLRDNTTLEIISKINERCDMTEANMRCYNAPSSVILELRRVCRAHESRTLGGY